MKDKKALKVFASNLVLICKRPYTVMFSTEFENVLCYLAGLEQGLIYSHATFKDGLNQFSSWLASEYNLDFNPWQRNAYSIFSNDKNGLVELKHIFFKFLNEVHQLSEEECMAVYPYPDSYNEEF